MKQTLLCLILLAIAMTQPSNAQDWAQLYYYHDANQKLSPPKKGEDRFVFMGNSITEGWNSITPGLFDNPQYINRGIGSQTTGQMKIRFWQDVIELQPTKVFILAGINDIAQNHGYVSLDEISQNILDMAQLARAQGIEVYLCSILPANFFPWRPQILPADMVITLNKMIQMHCRNNDYFYVDFYARMVNDEKGMQDAYTTDGVHCTEAGYRKMEEILKPYLDY